MEWYQGYYLDSHTDSIKLKETISKHLTMNDYDYNDGEGGRRNRSQEIVLQDRTSNFYIDPKLLLPGAVSDMEKKIVELSRKMKLQSMALWVQGLFLLVLTGTLAYLLIVQLTKEPTPNVCRGRSAKRWHDFSQGQVQGWWKLPKWRRWDHLCRYQIVRTHNPYNQALRP